jgi:probable F420-dependent oxidoreductase
LPENRRGLAIPFPGIALRDHRELFRRAEAAGYDDLWSGDNYGPDGFTPLVLAAAATERIRLGTGIIGTFTRGPAVLAQHASALADASGGRFVLGLGSSSQVIVEQWNRCRFDRPVATMRDTIGTLRSVLGGGRGPGGFRLDPPPEFPVPIVVAGLRGRMLSLAAELGDGGFLHAVPLSGVPRVVASFGDPAKELICRFHCIPGPEETGMPVAKRLFLTYATTPVYTEFYRWLGWGDSLVPALRAWHSGQRREALERCPDELVRQIYLFGTPEEMNERHDDERRAAVRASDAAHPGGRARRRDARPGGAHLRRPGLGDLAAAAGPVAAVGRLAREPRRPPG